MSEFPWWKDAVVYHVYLLSFADGNGDGVGDLHGALDPAHTSSGKPVGGAEAMAASIQRTSPWSWAIRASAPAAR